MRMEHERFFAMAFHDAEESKDQVDSSLIQHSSYKAGKQKLVIVGSLGDAPHEPQITMYHIGC